MTDDKNKASGSLPDLHVPGFPDYFSFGGCSGLYPNDSQDFISAKASSAFKYAGNGGDGDPDNYLTDDTATRRTIKLARDVEKGLPEGQTFQPVMVSYTCNMSGGGVGNLDNETKIMHSYGNFILALQIAAEHVDDQHPSPVSFVINPDFIGECQRQAAPDRKMKVREPLTSALQHRGVNTKIPDDITDTLTGYVKSVNWLAHQIAGTVSFGWQVNLWGVGSSRWIYKEKNDAVQAAKSTADYAKSIGIFDSTYNSTFLAVDRYERDDFDLAAYANGYCFSSREWDNFYTYCHELAKNTQKPIMPWQIPASHIPVASDNLADFKSHGGTGGSYLFGQASVGSKTENIHPDILSLKTLKSVTGVDTVQ